MSLNNNAVSMHIEERAQSLKRFKELYERLDDIIEALYQPALYTCTEFDRMACQYRVMQHEVDLLEDKIRKNFPGKDLDKTLKWLKSNPKDEVEDERVYSRNQGWLNVDEEWSNMNNGWQGMEEPILPDGGEYGLFATM